MKTYTQKSFVSVFLVRWFVCALGLWIAASIFQRTISYQDNLVVIVIGGALLALLNTLVRPLLVLVSMPALLLSLGLFMVVLNGSMVALMSHLYGAFQVTSFWAAMGAGIIIGLVNYAVTAILKPVD